MKHLLSHRLNSVINDFKLKKHSKYSMCKKKNVVNIFNIWTVYLTKHEI